MTRRLLIVEDDRTTARFLEDAFEAAGFSTATVTDGGEAFYAATSEQFDAIILDRMLPRLDGLSLLKALRGAGHKTPVVILSALNALEERVRGLEVGADDYLTKPFGFSELLARVNAVLRRNEGAAETVLTLECADLRMDLAAHRVSRAGVPIDLREREFRVLQYFWRHQNQVITRTMLLEGVWSQRFDPGTNVVEVHISNLRQTIDRDREAPLLQTIRGVGYMMSARR